MEIKKVGVVGAGVMGIGVGQSLAQNGMEAVLVDISEEVLDRARAEIRKNLRFQGMFQKDAKKEDPATVLGRIHFTTLLEDLGDVDFVVENVPEKWEIKSQIYPKIDAICPERAVFAVNTSCYSITRVGALTRRPDRVIGMHFMNPVPLKPMVEAIRGYHTSEATIETARQFLRQMGKDFILVNDMPGFVSNRVLMLTINEAVYVLQDGVATPEQVDQLFKTCFGHKMGPLETADLIGLDTILYSIEVLHESYNDSKYRPCPLLKKMVDAGLHGRKNGKGFYDYGIS
ncbi:MAG TPA: 3-hydroxyacyl-CoA dehydrogenase NAD-binding domain-containing protein [Thermoanaerobaculia bacterium]